MMMPQPMMMGPPHPMMMAQPPRMMPMYQQQYSPWMMQPPMPQYIQSFHQSVPMAPTANGVPQYYMPAPTMVPCMTAEDAASLPTKAKVSFGATIDDYQEEYSSSDEEEHDY